MKLNKKMLGLVLSGMLAIGMVGCSSDTGSDNTFDTTQYLTEQGKQAVKNSKSREYVQITEWTPLMGDYKDKYVKVSGTVGTIHQDEKMTTFAIHVEDNNTAYPVYINIPSSNVDIQFTENDVITVNGRFTGIENKELEDGSVISRWVISGYVLEKGDTTKQAEEPEEEQPKKEAKENKEKGDDKDNTATGNKATDKADHESVSTETGSTDSKSTGKSSTTKKQTTKKEVTHKCSVCGSNATKYHEQWLCKYCYEDKMAYLAQTNSSYCDYCGCKINGNTNGENLCSDCYTELNQEKEEYIYCRGCGLPMNDDNGGTYACNECLNMNN